MFVRKRKIKLKSGEISEIYQAVRSYRESGKVKKCVVALGKHSSMQDALEELEMTLTRIEKQLLVPLDKYRTEIRWAEKIREKLLKNYEKLKEKHYKLLNIERAERK